MCRKMEFTVPLMWSCSRESTLMGKFMVDKLGLQGTAMMGDGLVSKLTLMKKLSNIILHSCNSGTCPLLAPSVSPGLEHREKLWFPSLTPQAQNQLFWD